MCGAVIKELRRFVHGVCGALRMLGSEFANGGEQCGVNGAGIKQESAKYLENAQFVGGIKGRSSVWERRKSMLHKKWLNAVMLHEYIHQQYCSNGL
jgi:hypothetical protein